MVRTLKEYKEGDVIKESEKLREKIQEEKDATSIDLLQFEIFGELTQGHYLILPRGMKILNHIYCILRTYLQEPLDFEEVVLPKMALVSTFKKAALLPKWNPHLLSANPYSETRGIDEEFILDPLQCTVFYQYHQDKEIDVSKLPRKWFDRSGPSYRNEDSDKLIPGIRQREFHRAEFIYIGKKDQVIETREACLSQLEKLCLDLNLEYRIVVGAGCHRFREDEKTYSEDNRLVQIKDIEIYCPGYGFLEVSGNSVLGNALTSRFNISGADGEELWSGCTGVGLNRMIYAILSNGEINGIS